MQRQPRENAIELEGVGVRRDGQWILRDVSWRVPAGACAAILGPNGSGKSTLSRIIGGHLWPSAGAVRVLGERFGDADLPALRERIRLVQAAGPYDVDSELNEVVITGFFGTLGLYREMTADQVERADQLLASVGLSRVAGHRYSTLSSGERVRALIARALASRPELLLLDEPTAGLDLLAREQVLATVEQLFDRADSAHPPPTVLLVTHHLEELPPAVSAVLLLDEGNVAASGTPAEVLRADKLSAVYRCPLSVENRHGRYHVHVSPSAWKGLLDR
jgi:iron complex transport system ATP-binding protein